ncbi:acetate--CoA ligase family protein [Paracraurococcus lichenis]|uniref:Acetate--CoA ligase family protein n=1 Tax=Paracraurococcus lichenis TaxID=3064888 RepID=A0ABT9E4X0_9PROT|nr:acetate--CoA ligase family protein [Paracraurococcus sp. LOR1-02]MDO9711194.1 acetate--CoA ligase family protein [Paracraurococcus sp. LOR1-02]
MSGGSGPEPLRDPARLRRVLSPRSVAVIGVSAEPTRFGGRTVTNLVDFAGPVWGVNPKYAGQTLHGRPCLASLDEIPESPDCVLIALPREQMMPAVEACIRKGAGGIIAFASGYGETGLAERVAEEAALRDRCRAADMPLVGVNCLGIVDHVLKAGVTFMPEYVRMTAPPGGVAITSQSGALGYALMQAAERGFSVCHMVTAGNATDLDVCDLAAYQLSMPECRAVALAVEGLRDGRRLMLLGEAARKAGKPIVALKLGRGDAGAAAAASHTGSLAGSALAWSAAFRRAGMVEVEDFDALLETAGMFAKAPPPKAKGVAIITPSGGAGIMAADQAEALDLPMPQPLPETEAVLRAAIPDFGAPRNPCDLTAQVASNPASYDACMEAMLSDPQYGCAVIPQVYSHHATTVGRMESLRPYATKFGKPLLIAWIPEQLEGPGAVHADSVPELILFRSMRRLMHAVKLWHQYYDQREEGAPQAPAGLAEALAALPPGPRVLAEAESKALFARVGVPVTEERRGASAEAAADQAVALGFPVVLKLDSPDIAHKTEVGGVKLHLGDADAVRGAFAEIMASAKRHAPAARLDGVLVQPMARKGVELILGGRRDGQFGPMVLVGTGGVQAELWKDVALDIAPVTPTRAEAMLRSLKGFPLLDGFRGAPKADIAAVARAVSAFSVLLAAAGDRIEEAEANPLIAGEWGCLAVDGLVRCGADPQK